MQDNDIKKAIEFCSADKVVHCEDCPFYAQCLNDENLFKPALDYINRLEAENDRKGKIYIDLLKTSSARADMIYDLQAEKIELFEKTEQLQAENERLNTLIAETNEQRGAVIHAITRIDEVKAEAYKEFADRLKEVSQHEIYCDNTLPKPIIIYHIIEDKIDNLLKEMVSE